MISLFLAMLIVLNLVLVIMEYKRLKDLEYLYSDMFEQVENIKDTLKNVHH